MKKAFHTFQEYLTHKGKVQDKPSVEKIADYSGPKPKSPGKATTKGKGWEVPNVGKKGTPAAYKNGTDKAPKKAEKGGFGDMGDKSLIYNPDPKDGWHGGKEGVSKSTNGVTGGKETKTWPKGGSTTESFLASTKGMNTSQFAKHIKKSMTEHCGCEDKKAPHVVAYSVGAFHPDPIQAIRYVSYLANENVNLRRALIREANRAGCAKAMLQELLQLPEAFATLAEIIDGEQGEVFNRRLDKAIRENRELHKKKAKINEEVDEPAHDDDNLDADSDGDGDDPSEEDLDDEGNPKKKKGDDLGLDDDDMGDDLDGDEGDDMGGDDMGDEDGPPPPPEDHDMGGDDMGDEDGPPPPPEDHDMGGDEDGGDLGGDMPPAPNAGKKPGKPDFGDMGDEDMGDEDGKIDFGGDDDDDLGDKKDVFGGDDDDLDGDMNDDLSGDDDDLGDDEDDDGLGDDNMNDDDDEDDSPHSFRKHLKKKKMPWEDEV